MHTASYQAALEGRQGETRLFAGWSGRDFGANGFYGSPRFTEQYEKIHTTLLSLDASRRFGNWVWKPRAYWRFNQDEYIFTRANPAAYRNLHRSHIAGAELHAQYTSRWGISGFGLDAGRQLLYSNRLGTRTRNTVAFFAEQRFAFGHGKIDVTPGILWNSYSDFGTQWLPGVEAGWQASPSLRVYANAGYTFRVPTFTDLYYQDPGNQGNPDLKPESALAWESGLKWQQNRASAAFALFDRRSENLIDWTKAVDSEPWRTRNLGQVSFRGAEIQGELHVAPFLPRLGTCYTFIHASQSADPVYRSRYALDQLRHQLVLFADFRVGKHLTASLRGRYLDRVNLEDYTVLDTRLSWKAGKWSAFVEACNLTNTDYTETSLVPMPGRWASAGLNIRLEKK
jgi:iron complex outermembrane receptor protein